MDLHLQLQSVAQNHYPDFHLKVGRKPTVRILSGELQEVQDSELVTADTILAVVKEVLPADKWAQFQKGEEVDAAYTVMGVGRFRLNAFMELDGPSLAFRSIPKDIPTLTQLQLPPIVRSFTEKHSGLILVTGPTGSGKSTTMAAMVHEINQARKSHIITIEDPIEFVHTPLQSMITQREVGVHTPSFPSAIRSALRQDPDVILVGEMRDLETISSAITLAETGHLVMATLHTQDAAQAIDRMIDVFPSHQQMQVRTQLSAALIGIIAQRLIPNRSLNGRALALEVLVRNDAITNCIKEGNTHQIYSMMQVGKADGMLTLDASLASLFSQGLISEETIQIWAKDPNMVKNLIGG